MRRVSPLSEVEKSRHCERIRVKVLVVVKLSALRIGADKPPARGGPGLDPPRFPPRRIFLFHNMNASHGARPTGRCTARPGSHQLPFPRFPIWLGNGEGIPDSRLRRNRESGNPPFPDSAGTVNRGPGTGNRGPAGGTPGISGSVYTVQQASLS
jgi:hypothetical protein